MDAIKIDPLVECLKVICQHFARPMTRDALLSGLPVSESGLTPQLFSRAAARAELSAKLIKKDLSTLTEGLMPACLLLEDNQACVILSRARDAEDQRQYEIIYPELPEVPVMISAQELESKYVGIMFLAKPKPLPQLTGVTEHANRGHWFWSVLRKNIPVYKDVLLAALLINVFALALPLFTMNVYDRVVPNHAVETLWVLAAGVILILIFDALLKTLRGYFLDLASRRVDIQLSSSVMAKVLGLRLEARPASVGSFAAGLRGYETVRDFVTSATLSAIIDLPFTVIFLLVIGWIAWPMALPVLVAMIIALILALLSRGPLARLSESTYAASAERNGALIESLVGLDTLKAMGAEAMMQRRWERSAAFLARAAVKLRLVAMANVNSVAWLQQLMTVFVIVVGVYMISAGELTLGGLIACSMLSGRAFSAVSQISGLLGQYHNARQAYDSLNEIMGLPVERESGKAFISRPNLQGNIEFKNVSFSYPDQDMKVLDGINLKIKAGERIAILGRVGSGKTTLKQIILGLYEVTDGAVLIDGIDSRQLDPAELRQQVGFSPQDVTLFAGSLRENLILTHPYADDAAVLRAAEFANLHELINAHPKGFDLSVGERGSNLSGGQRKCVALARAVVHEPKVLLFDEPTGSLDHSTEAWVKAKLAEFSQGRTLLLSTHRTSMLELVDRIIVLDAGKIVADGPKEQVVDALRKGKIGRAGA